MISKCFVIYDSKVEAYLHPFFLRNAGEALREVERLATDRDWETVLFDA